jgi:hypothetical protein
MRRFVAGLCCFIVGLQVLIGVPAAVTVGLLCLWTGGGFGPAPTIPPPGDFAVSLPPSPQDAPSLNAALESRQRNGSPLAETSLSNGVEPGQDDRDFAAAFQFVAAEAHTNQFQVPLPAALDAAQTGESITVNAVVISPARPPVTADAAAPDLTGTIRYLYASAERHESDGNYPRADELRILARALRREFDLSDGASSLSPIASAAPTPAASQSAETAPVPPLESGQSAPLEVDREAANPEPNQPRAN